MAGNGPVGSLGGLWVTGRREHGEQSGIANNRPRDFVILK